MMKDKKYHILAGAALPVYLETLNLFAGLWACLAGIIAGGVKEWSDMAHDGRFDWRDFAATAIGAAIVAVFIIGLHFGKG